MARILDIQEFVKDYCLPLSDRDLINKYQISAKELIPLIRKLVIDGFITKEHHQERTRKMKQREAVQEKSFLKSLYHCPLCNHIHPTPFEVCPACGTSIADPRKSQRAQPRPTAPQQQAMSKPINPRASQTVRPTPKAPQQSVKFLDEDDGAMTDRHLNLDRHLNPNQSLNLEKLLSLDRSLNLNLLHRLNLFHNL